MDITGQVAVVTGAARGIGVAIAQRLLESGARVVLADLPGADWAPAREVVARHTDDAVTFEGDAASEADIVASVALAEERFGPVTMYVANAGVGLDGLLTAPEEMWTTVLEVNVMAHVRAARVLVPRWVEAGSGCFVSVASAAGLLTQIGSATYAVSKHAAVAFAEWLAVTHGADGVQVSCVCPMGVNTPLLHGDSDTPEHAQRARAAVKDAGSVIEPLQVADDVVAAVREGRFLVLPHPEVLEMYRHKGSDYDRWIRGMQRFQASLAP